MNEISIVTAFFDIGRGDWTPDRGLPHYLHRTTDTYLQRFGYLAQLDNQITVYTSKDLMDKVYELRAGKEDKTNIVEVDFANEFQDQRELIKKIQNNPDFLKQIDPHQVRNPEYWSPDYVLVNKLKAHFVNHAINSGLATEELVAWLDFGYCRDASALSGVKEWKYPFNKDKIHFFNFREYQGQPINEIISTNLVHMFGAKIVAGREMWEKLEELINGAFKNLTDANLIDDDQTLMLLAYLYDKDLFELHPINENDPFVAFRSFNASSD
jgi:protein YibB